MTRGDVCCSYVYAATRSYPSLFCEERAQSHPTPKATRSLAKATRPRRSLRGEFQGRVHPICTFSVTGADGCRPVAVMSAGRCGAERRRALSSHFSFMVFCQDDATLRPRNKMREAVRGRRRERCFQAWGACARKYRFIQCSSVCSSFFLRRSVDLVIPARSHGPR